MPRTAQNPMKKMRRSFAPQRVTACTVVYIPELTGYWAHSFEVLKVCLASLLASTRVPFDLFVLDNGSCEPVRSFLLELNRRGDIHCLMSSAQNMGKLGAWNVLFPACPGEFIAFCDSDILFRPGWLERSLEMFDEFPDLGVVTARPGRTASALRATTLSSTLRFAETGSGLDVERGKLIDQAILDEFARSLGPSVHPGLAEKDYEDIRVTRNGRTFYIDASHYQFVVRRSLALAVLPIDSERALAGAEGIWDERVDRMGKLRIALDAPLVRHLGNTLSDEELAEITAEYELDGVLADRRAARSATPTGGPIVRNLRALARIGAVKRALNRAYLTLFEALSEHSGNERFRKPH